MSRWAERRSTRQARRRDQEVRRAIRTADPALRHELEAMYAREQGWH